MASSWIKNYTRSAYGRLLTSSTREMGEGELSKPAVVFAPHPDDETLGCGGTIIRKLGSGANVSVVFVTDGGKSHSKFMPPEEMREIRVAEAIEAGHKLGLSDEDLIFIHARNGQLGEDRGLVLREVLRVLREKRPGQVFAPYFRDTPVGSNDHADTNWLVLTALRKHGGKLSVLEYPIWYWQHWPWTRKPDPGALGALKHIGKSWIQAVNMLWELNCRVSIKTVESQKMSALESHRSQMTHYMPGVRWRTLQDISGGQFVASFFGGRELFYSYDFNGSGKPKGN
jgi:LmbE family N-acetylglucosaminyl deacetylase